jgi:hypothetical protein
MNKLETTGKIYVVNPEQTRGTFTFRTFVIETGDNPKYPQFVEFQTTRDNIGKLDAFAVGDEIKIEFNLKGREWKNPTTGEVKYFTTLDAWKFEKVGAAKPVAQGTPPVHPNAPSQPSIPDDDIPFLSCDMAHEPSPIARVLR